MEGFSLLCEVSHKTSLHSNFSQIVGLVEYTYVQ